MDQQHSAVIIPFPIRNAEPVSPTPVVAPGAARLAAIQQTKLPAAMSSLSQALAEQRAAVAVWRDAVRDLNDQMQALNASLAASKLIVAKKI